MESENTMKTPRRIVAVLLSVALAMSAGLAQAASLEGQQFDDSAKVGDATLHLNGLGLRSILFIKVYVAGLYVPEKAGNAAAIQSQKGPKRMELRPLRDTDAADFKKAMVGGLKNNATDAAFAQMAPAVKQLEGVVDMVGNLKKGDVIVIDFTPGRGVTIALNGSVKGTAIPGDDFSSTLLAIFIGEQPVDAKLKKGLLGAS